MLCADRSIPAIVRQETTTPYHRRAILGNAWSRIATELPAHLFTTKVDGPLHHHHFELVSDSVRWLLRRVIAPGRVVVKRRSPDATAGHSPVGVHDWLTAGRVSSRLDLAAFAKTLRFTTLIGRRTRCQQ